MLLLKLASQMWISLNSVAHHLFVCCVQIWQSAPRKNSVWPSYNLYWMLLNLELCYFLWRFDSIPNHPHLTPPKKRKNGEGAIDERDSFTRSVFLSTDDPSMQPCPRSITQAMADRGRFMSDEECNPSNRDGCSRFHEGAVHCFKMVNPR